MTEWPGRSPLCALQEEIPMSRIALACGVTFVFAIVGCTPSAKQSPPSQGESEWRWSENEASLQYCARNQLKKYEVQVVRPANYENSWEPFIVRIVDKGQEIYSFPAHSETVFTQEWDVVYVADFSPIASGCTVVAYDLKERKELWRCPLKGNPPQAHSEYRHQVNITTRPGAVVIYGKESNGRYIEFVDMHAGKTIEHKKLPPEP
jgi:hypothetical protein